MPVGNNSATVKKASLTGDCSLSGSRNSARLQLPQCTPFQWLSGPVPDYLRQAQIFPSGTTSATIGAVRPSRPASANLTIGISDLQGRNGSDAYLILIAAHRRPFIPHTRRFPQVTRMPRVFAVR